MIFHHPGRVRKTESQKLEMAENLVDHTDGLPESQICCRSNQVLSRRASNVRSNADPTTFNGRLLCIPTAVTVMMHFLTFSLFQFFLVTLLSVAETIFFPSWYIQHSVRCRLLSNSPLTIHMPSIEYQGIKNDKNCVLFMLMLQEKSKRHHSKSRHQGSPWRYRRNRQTKA